MIKISIDCEENDWEDMKYGGPRYLGFNFPVEDDIDKIEYEQFIREKLKQYGHGCIDIKFIDIPKPKAWTKEEIEECIKNTKF